MLYVRVALFALLMPGTVVLWAPAGMILGFHLGRPAFNGFGSLGIASWMLGLAVASWCVRDFARRGQGTPAPYDPPRRLVSIGLYRFTRNPMYLGVLAMLLGEAILWRSLELAVYTAAMGLGFHLFIVFYEEPTLHRLFGEEYARYRGAVGRWLSLPKIKR